MAQKWQRHVSASLDFPALSFREESRGQVGLKAAWGEQCFVFEFQFQDNKSWSCWQQQCVLFQSLAFPEIKRQGAGAGNGTAKVHLDGVNKDVQQARWGVENGHVFCRKVIGMGAWQELDQPRWGWLPQVDGQVIRQPGPGSTGGLPNMLCALRAWGNTVGLLC